MPNLVKRLGGGVPIQIIPRPEYSQGVSGCLVAFGVATCGNRRLMALLDRYQRG